MTSRTCQVGHFDSHVFCLYIKYLESLKFWIGCLTIQNLIPALSVIIPVASDLIGHRFWLLMGITRCIYSHTRWAYFHLVQWVHHRDLLKEFFFWWMSCTKLTPLISVEQLSSVCSSMVSSLEVMRDQISSYHFHIFTVDPREVLIFPFLGTVTLFKNHVFQKFLEIF